MAYKRGKKALFEVINNDRLKSSYEKNLESLYPEDTGDNARGVEAENAQTHQADRFYWPNKPRMLQLNAGRIEISIPFQLAIAVGLVMLALMLIVFRLGQSSVALGKADELAVPEKKNIEFEQVYFNQPVTTGIIENLESGNIAAGVSKGTNHIVIKEFIRTKDLAEVAKFFALAGIGTEIIKIDNTYFLRTKEKYENPSRVGSNGYAALLEIKRIGAKYKAPPDFETFGSKPFQDAYGRKFSD
jgi:hypothetical protein